MPKRGKYRTFRQYADEKFFRRIIAAYIKLKFPQDLGKQDYCHYFYVNTVVDSFKDNPLKAFNKLFNARLQEPITPFNEFTELHRIIETEFTWNGIYSNCKILITAFLQTWLVYR